MGKKNQRSKQIIDLFQTKTFISIKELVSHFNVSEMTIRRDLSLLSSENLVELIPGGVVAKPNAPGDEKYLITREETQRMKEKEKIARLAVSMIAPNETIILDAGSTTEYLAKFIPDELPVTVLCHAVNTFVELYRKKNCNLILAGGYLHPTSLIFESHEGLELIRKTRADKAFIGASAVSGQLGITCIHHYEVEIKKAIMNSAKTRILIVDSSKFGQVKVIHFADLREFDMVITDSEISREYTEIIRNLGIDLQIV